MSTSDVLAEAAGAALSGPANARLRICLLADATSIHVQRWALYFAGRGHEVHIVTTTPCDFDHRVIVHELDVVSGEDALSRLLPKVRGIEARLRSAWRARQVIRSIDADIVHAHFLASYGQIAYLSGVAPYAISVWGSDVFGVGHRGFERWLSRRALRSAAAVLCDSSDLRMATIRLGSPEAITELIGFGVDTRLFRLGIHPEELRRELGLSPEALVVLSPRIVDANYNTLAIVEGFARAAATNDRLVLVIKHYRGSRAYRDDVVQRIEALHLADRVRWVGEVSHHEIPAFYALADVVVSMASPDSAPVSVLEALACGAVVVASDLPSLREWIIPGENGYLSAPSSPCAIANAIVAALALPTPTRLAWAQTNHDRVRRTGEETGEMAKAENIYATLAARRAHR